MVKLVQYNPEVHRTEYVKMSKDYMIWLFDELDETFGLNSRSYIEVPFDEWLEGIVDPFEKLEPPNGILYMVEVDGEIAGMGALKKLSESVGEIKRMYNKPEFRGRGIGRAMITRLLEDGERFGCQSFKLDTPKVSLAAQHLYKSLGFEETDKYPESEIPQPYQDYWLYMEKK